MSKKKVVFNAYDLLNSPEMSAYLDQHEAEQAEKKKQYQAEMTSNPRLIERAAGLDKYTPEQLRQIGEDAAAERAPLGEKVARVGRNLYGNVAAGSESIMRGAGDVGADILDAVGANETAQSTRDYWRGRSDGLKEYVRENRPQFDSQAASSLYSGVESTARMAPGLVASVLSGTPAAMLAYGAADAGAGGYSEAREAGYNPAWAALNAANQAGAEYITEKIPAEKLIGDLAQKSGLFKTLGHQIATEVPGENVATLLQDASNQSFGLDGKKKGDWSQYAADRPGAAIDTTLATVAGTGIHTGAAHAISRAMGKEAEQQQAQPQGQPQHGPQPSPAEYDPIAPNQQALLRRMGIEADPVAEAAVASVESSLGKGDPTAGLVASVMRGDALQPIHDLSAVRANTILPVGSNEGGLYEPQWLPDAAQGESANGLPMPKHGFDSQEKLLGNVRLDARDADLMRDKDEAFSRYEQEQQQAAARKPQDLERVYQDSIVPATIDRADASNQLNQSLANAQGEGQAQPTALQLALQAAQEKAMPAKSVPSNTVPDKVEPASAEPNISRDDKLRELTLSDASIDNNAPPALSMQQNERGQWLIKGDMAQHAQAIREALPGTKLVVSQQNGQALVQMPADKDTASQGKAIRKALDHLVMSGEQLAQRDSQRQAASERVKARNQQAQQIDPAQDDILQAVAKLGGIDTDQAMSEWWRGQPETIGHYNGEVPGNLRRQGVFAFKRGGQPIDTVIRRLEGEGYLPEGATPNDLLDAIEQRRLHPAGMEERARREFEARQQEEAPGEFQQAYDDGRFADEFTASELEEDGFFDLNRKQREAAEAAAEAAKSAELDKLIDNAQVIASQSGPVTEEELDAIFGPQSRNTTTESPQADRGAATERTTAGAGGGAQATETAQTEDGFGLASYTESDLRREEQAAEQQQREVERQRAAADKARQDEETRKEIRRRSEAAADTFTLGGNAEDNLTGQGGLFDAPAETAWQRAERESKELRAKANDLIHSNDHRSVDAGKALDDFNDKIIGPAEFSARLNRIEATPSHDNKNSLFDRKIKIAADSVESLRASDVGRVLEQQQSPDSLRALADYITQHRQDLRGTIERDTAALMEENGWNKPETESSSAQNTADNNGNWLNELFGNDGTETAQQSVQRDTGRPKEVDFSLLVPKIRAFVSERIAEADDWAGRKYKHNEKQIHLDGDGPAKHESISISSANESRRRSTIDNLTHQANAAKSLIGRIERGENISHELAQAIEASDADIETIGKPRFGKTRNDQAEAYISNMLLGDRGYRYGKGTLAHLLLAEYENFASTLAASSAQNIGHSPEKVPDMAPNEASKAEIVAAIDALIATGERRRDAGEPPRMSREGLAYPPPAGDGDAMSAMNWLGDAERQQLHDLKQSLPSAASEREAAQARIKQKLERRKPSLNGGAIDSNEPKADYTDHYETDLFGNPLPNAGRKTRATKPAPSGVRRNVHAASALPGDTAAPDGEYRVRTIVGSESQRTLGARRITSPAELAAATSYLYRSAVERFDAIVTDASGKPLAVIGAFKGAIGQASVYPATLVGEAVRIPGAAHIWFSHNHPGGTAKLSGADRSLYHRLADVFDGSGITPMGLIAVANRQYASMEDSHLPIPQSSESMPVPVVERELAAADITLPAITSPQSAKDLASSLYKGSDYQPGMMLLNTQNQVAAWVPLPATAMGALRHSGGLNAIYRAISESNAGAVILVHGGELSERIGSVTLGQNIAAAVAKLDVRPLDIVDIRKPRSAAETGELIQSGPVYSKANDYTSTQGMSAKDLQAIIAKALPAHLRARVKVEQSRSNTARQSARSEDNDLIEAEYDPATGQLTLYADAIPTPERALFVLSHELTHYGLDEKYGFGLSSILLEARNNPMIAKLAAAIAVDRGMTVNSVRQDIADALGVPVARVARSVAINRLQVETANEALAELNAAIERNDFAYLQDRYGVAVPKMMRNDLRGRLSRLAASVKAWLAKLTGKQATDYSDKQVWDLLAGVRETVRNGGNVAESDGGWRNSGENMAETQHSSADWSSAVKREMDEVRNRYKGSAQWMKAPNGQPSKLGERQWLQVRTPSFKAWFGDWEEADHVRWLDTASSVATMRGDEVPKFSKLNELATWVGNHWDNTVGGGVDHPTLGKIVLDKKAASASIAHGIGPTKAQAFYLVADALGKGRVLGELPPVTGKPQAFIVAAPVGIGEKTYKLLMEVRRDANMQRLYVHEAVLREAGEQSSGRAFNSSAASHKGAEPQGAHHGAIYNFMLDVRARQASKVVDANGEPLVVYHGTAADFDAFDPERTGDSMDAGKLGIGAYFNQAAKWANTYSLNAAKNGGASNVMPAYLSLKNPVMLDGAGNYMAKLKKVSSEWGLEHRPTNDESSWAPNPEWAKEFTDAAILRGHDGVVLPSQFTETEYLVFSPLDIKSAIGNRGTFNGSDPNILRSTAQKQPASAGFSLPEETKTQAAQREVQDNMNRWKQVLENVREQGGQVDEQNDVYGAEERFHGRAATRIEDFARDEVEPLMERLADSGHTLQEVEQYLLAQHAEEANARIREIDDSRDTAFGMEDDEAQSILAKFAAMPDAAEFKRLANDFRRISEGTLSLYVKAGIVAPDAAHAMRLAYQFYVPVKGGDEDQAARQGTGKGLSVNGKQKRRMGHDMRDEHVLENILRDRQRAIVLAEKNNVGTYLLDLIERNPDPKLWTVNVLPKQKVLRDQVSYVVELNGQMLDAFNSMEAARVFIQAEAARTGSKPGAFAVSKSSDPYVTMMAKPTLQDHEVQVYVQGRAVRIQLHDPIMAGQYRRMGTEQMGRIIEAGKSLNRWLSKVYTGYNPEFFVKNVVRDLFAGTINLTADQGAKVTAKALWHWPKAGAAMFHFALNGKAPAGEYGKALQRYRAAGGSTGAAYMGDLERQADTLQTLLDNYSGAMAALQEGKPGKAAKIATRKLLGGLAHWFEVWNQAGENAFRLATFMAMQESGKTVAESASMAKNVTVNFNRKGELTPQLGGLYLFFNPGVQGTARLWQSLAGKDTKHKKQAWALVGSMAGAALALAMMNRGDDEDEWEAIPDSVKDRNLIIPLGNKRKLTIPLPYGYSFFVSLANRLDAVMHGESAEKASIRLASSLFENFSPVGNPIGDDPKGENLISMLPTAMKMVMQPAFGITDFGGPMRPEYNASQPDNEKMWRGTRGSLYDKAAQGISALHGSPYENNWNDVSPETLKYWVKTLTGGTGAFMADSASLLNVLASGSTPDVSEVPFMRSAVRESTVKDVRARFHELGKEAKGHVDAWKRAVDAGDDKAAGKYEQESELMALGEMLAGYKEQASTLRDLMAEEMKRDDLSLSEKRLKQKMYERQESDVYSEFNRQFKH